MASTRLPKIYVFGLIVCTVLFIAIGLWQIQRVADLTREHEQNRLLIQASMFAQTLPVDQCRTLTFSARDNGLPVFQRLQRQLRLVSEQLNTVNLFLIAKRNGQWVFGPAGAFTSGSNAPAPGTLYRRPPSALQTACRSGQQEAADLYTDEFGSKFSAFVPVVDPQTGSTMLVVGASTGPKTWQHLFVYARLVPLSLTLVLLALCFIGAHILKNRQALQSSPRRILRYAEPLICAGVMLAFTVSVTWYTWQTEHYVRDQVFDVQSKRFVSNISRQINDLHDKLNSFNWMFRASEKIDRRDFRQYSSTLADHPLICGAAWIPAVPASSRSEFETEARVSAPGDFRVWQHDAAGQRVPAAGRGTLYPVCFHAPENAPEYELGFDLSSVPEYAAALSESVRFNIPVAVAAPPQPQSSRASDMIYLFQPTASATQSGLVSLAVRLKTFVMAPFNGVPVQDLGLRADLFLLQEGQPPQLIAANPAPRTKTVPRWPARWTSLSIPVPTFFFGKTYVTIIHASPTWFAGMPLRATKGSLLSGLLLTTILSLFVAFLCNRRSALEQEVQIRTADLKTAHDNIRSVLNAAPMAMLVIDQKTCVRVVNRRATELFDAAPDHVAGQGCGVLLCCVNRNTDRRGCGHSPACASCDLFNAVKETLRTGRDIYDRDAAFTIQRNGEKQNVLLRFSVAPVIFDHKPHVVVALNDITAWHHSEQMYRTLFREMLYGLVIYKPILDQNSKPVDFEYLTANPAFEHLTGISVAHLPGKTLRTFASDFLPAIQTAYDQILKTGNAASFTYYTQSIQKYFAVTFFQPFPDQFACIFTDMTEHKKAEEQARAAAEEARNLLNEAEEARNDLIQAVEEQKRADEALIHERNLLYALMDNLPDRIYFKDIESHFVKISKAYALSLGLKTPADAIGKSETDFRTPEIAETIRNQEKQIVETGQPLLAQVEQKRGPDGKIHWVSASKAPIKDETGAVVGLVGISRDITPEIELQQQLQQALKMDAIGRLAGGVAHDFNNLLQVILGFTEVLLTGVSADDPQHADLKEIEKAAKRAADLTRQLLAFSRKQRIQPQVLNLNTIISGTEKMLRRLLGENIEIVLLLAPDVKAICADPSQIEQILMNLAVNAHDAMPHGGRLIFKTENIKLKNQDTVLFPESTPGSYTCLSVSDTGCGLKAELIPHLFEPFYTTKAKGKGTGLGLSVIYGIIKQNGGWINVYSEEGQGTTFKLYLPAREDAPAKLDDDDAKPTPFSMPGLGKTILLVEDEPGVRNLSTLVLQASGYCVFSCESAQAAKILFAQQNPKIDLLFSDVVLAGENGIDLAHDLRTIRPDLPVLLCSGYADDSVRWESIKKEGFHFIPKPYPTAQLLTSVHDVIESAASASSGGIAHA